MRCLIADSFEPEGIIALRALGLEITQDAALKDDALVAAITRLDPHVLIVRGTKVGPKAIEAGKSLGLVVRAGAGVNTIDVAAASARGVYVANCPGKNAAAVAELAFGLILALDRRIPDNVADLRAGKWDKKSYSEARGLKGRTLALIGLGGIGQEMVRIAKGFEMPIVAWSRSLTPARAAKLGVAHAETPADAAAACDVLSVHVALTPETRKLINAAVLSRLPRGAFFINTSRGEVVDHDALTQAIKVNGLRVGLDVFDKEPAGGTGAFDDPIVKTPGGVVYGTHHIGASTLQAQLAIADEAVRIVESYVHTGEAPNSVNLSAKSSAKRLLVVRHRNRPGVLAHVLGVIGQAKINVEEMENVIFSDAHAACARIRLDEAPSAEVLERIRVGNENILAIGLVDLPTN
ncbi:MAG: NAD(P)-binding domain-containing protein [Planctomycetota bacterium]|nr:NAD(P)-binding domain-containing protein [Planctomycetota bacterium]